MALQPAVLGVGRLGNFRLGYVPTALSTTRSSYARILINGVEARTRVRRNGLQIRDALNDAPNTCSLTVDGTAPTVSQTLRILVNSNTPRVLFAGTFQTVDLSYEGYATNRCWSCTAIDDTARVNAKRPFGTWVDISATTIALAMVAEFAPAFGTTYIEAALPTVSITFDGSADFIQCLTRLANAVGGYCKIEDLNVYLFLSDVTEPPDNIDATAHRFLDDPPITISRDVSQLRTRVYGKGHAEALLSDVLSGDTILPVNDSVMYNVGGGRVIAGTTADGASSEILAYTGTVAGGAGSLVGPGATPSVAPGVWLTGGAGLADGVFQYAYTDVTASGESLPSPSASITTGTIPAPAAFTLTNLGFDLSSNIIAGTYSYGVTYVPVARAGTIIAGFETTSSPTVAITVATGDRVQLNVGVGRSVTARQVYRTANGGAQLKSLSTIFNNAQTTAIDGNADAALGANVPVSNTAVMNQVVLTGIALGGTGTTQRKVYRTAAGGAQLKLQQTIANNTVTVGVTDATVDGSLGANVPTSDTSGLTQPAGQVNAGSTSLPTASAGPFQSGGGWAILSGDQLVRYTGITGNTLTGIPASGAGAIATTVLYGQQILPAPSLTGVTGLTVALSKGSPVHIWVQRDDLSAQATQAAIDGSDGIVEYLITDERRGEDSLGDLCDADLAQFSLPLVTVTYASRDTKTKSGKTVVINLASPAISETLTIQDVTITEIDQAPGTLPRFTATASNVRFSLEALLRKLAN